MGRPAADMTGQRFGKLVVLSRALVHRSRSALWRCQCDCGAVKTVPGHNLRRGAVKTCNTGCKRKGRTPFRNMTPERQVSARARKTEWALRNRERTAQRKRAHYYANRDKYLTIERDRAYRARYGITLADYDRMLKEQDSRCAICGSDRALKNNERTWAFAVDHCHTTGKVRGLLCNACNVGLGWFERHAPATMEYLAK